MNAPIFNLKYGNNLKTLSLILILPLLCFNTYAIAGTIDHNDLLAPRSRWQKDNIDPPVTSSFLLTYAHQHRINPSIIDNLQNIGLNIEEIKYLFEYTIDFLNTNQNCFKNNLGEILSFFANPNKISLPLIPAQIGKGQNIAEWKETILHPYSFLHRNFINNIPMVILRKIFTAKLLTGPRERAIKHFLKEHLRRSPTLDDNLKKVLSTLSVHRNLAEQCVSIDSVFDYSSGRGDDQGAFVLKVTLNISGHIITIFLKGVGVSNKKDQTNKEYYEPFFFSLATLLGLKSIVVTFYKDTEDEHIAGIDFMQEIQGISTDNLFTLNNGTYKLKPQFCRHKALLISGLARWAALSDLINKGDRKIVHPVLQQYPANYIVDLDRLALDENAICAIDNYWIFNETNEFVESELQGKGSTEIGILTALDEFNNPTDRERLFTEYCRAYCEQWSIILSHKQKIEQLIVETFGENSYEHNIFKQSIKREPKGEFEKQKKALLSYVEKKDPARLTRRESLGAIVGLIAGIVYPRDNYASEKRSTAIKISSENGRFFWQIGEEKIHSMQGMVYHPVPDGKRIYEDFIAPNKLSILYKALMPTSRCGQGHGEQLHAMGVKAIRVYQLPITDVIEINEVKRIFRYVFENYGIRVLVGDWCGLYIHPNDWDKNTAEVETLVRIYADEEWVLAFDLGNENNYFLRGDLAETKWGYKGTLVESNFEQFLLKMNRIALAARKVSARKPFILGLGEFVLKKTEEVQSLNKKGILSGFDAIGINSYGNPQRLQTILKNLQMPVLFTEMGTYGIEITLQNVREIEDYYMNIWQTISEQANCLGGFFFQATNDSTNEDPNGRKMGILGKGIYPFGRQKLNLFPGFLGGLLSLLESI